MIDTVELPDFWYKIHISNRKHLISCIDKQQSIFVNVRERLFSLSPVMSLAHLEPVIVSINVSKHAWNLTDIV